MVSDGICLYARSSQINYWNMHQITHYSVCIILPLYLLYLIPLPYSIEHLEVSAVPPTPPTVHNRIVIRREGIFI
jgi:hypothetical protein